MGKSRENKPKLLDDSSSESEVDFKINKSYASSYEKWRQGEELQKLKDKYGSDTDTSSSSESEEVAPVVEKDFLKALSLLKSKDPQIYDENVQLFKEDSVPEKRSKEKKPKPLYPKDYERKMLLEHNGELSDEDDDDDGGRELKQMPPTYDEEQEEIKRVFKAALSDSESEKDDDEDLLKVREKDQKKKEQEEADYIQWLKGEKKGVENNEDADLKFLQRFWNDPKLDESEKFLKDYILNKKYLEEDDDEEEIPTYEEITNDVGTLSDDEKLLEKQDIFEHKYNFRFEEPDQEFIKKYPRTVGDSLRRKDNKRKLKREEYQERKKREKEQKKEELKRLKALKRKEIEEKLEKLRETVGNEQLAFDDLDVDGEFDPDEHDRKMQQMFNDDFYNVEEPERPEFPSDEDIDHENWDNWTGEGVSHGGVDGYDESGGHDGPHFDDPDFNMDADYDPKLAFQKQMIESSMKKNKRHRKRSKFAEAVTKSKPVFDPSSKTFEKYFDEYYKLDCEDIIGDLPVRFKYRNVVPNDFGLSVDEILAAKDKELNRWCSLKKTCQYRKEDEEMYDLQAFQKKSQNEFSKKKVFLSLYGEPEENLNASENTEGQVAKKKRKKKKRKNTDMETETSTEKPEVAVESMTAEDGNDEDGITLDRPSSIKDLSNGVSFDRSDSAAQGGGKRNKKRKRSEEDVSVSSALNDSVPEESNPVKDESDIYVPPHKRVAKSSDQTMDSLNDSATKSKKKRKRKKTQQNVQDANRAADSNAKRTVHKFVSKNRETADKRLSIPDSRLKAYGINPKKFKNRLKYSKKS